MQPEKKGLHPRNRHRDRYDFGELTRACPELTGFVRPNPYGDLSIDFADPDAVRALNRALLRQAYGIAWDLPPGFLCPPIPGRADYLHYAADLLAGGGPIPRGDAVRVLDIGVGANCIYPLLGHREYGWHFLGSDIDPAALAWAGRIVQDNGLGGAIELRRQPDPGNIFQGLLRDGESFALSICNPPFHASPGAAREGSRRKLANLGQGGPLRLNFGGRAGELWCQGGELGFLRRMIAESARFATRCRWFSALVSRSANLPDLRRALAQAGALATRTLDMAQGQKQSRILAWSFHPSYVGKERSPHAQA
ncbi:MAG: 23S rRNA (adenine(1618)-N(6))-methyltransferase RlmF [Holophaga sp.]|nr:23S rRNA (adenine(1618)-N(6))-methyltransferase RlmF [Holophaga sp.]